MTLHFVVPVIGVVIVVLTGFISFGISNKIFYKKCIVSLSVLIVLLAGSIETENFYKHSYIPSITVGQQSGFYKYYMPFTNSSKLSRLEEKSSLRFSKEDELPVVDGATALVPAAKVGHIGICRADSQPDGLQVYYNKLPFDIEEREVIILDLMIGTGRTAAKAIDVVQEAGAKTVKVLSVVTCPEGVEYVQSKHPDIDIFCGALDDHLNDDLYIVPGIGDGGDRIFGTK